MEEKHVDQRERIRYQNVRRRLFQNDDEDNNDQSTNNDEGRKRNGENDNFANLLFEEARRNSENAKEKWNFDFENEVPLPGRYEWVKVDHDGNEISDSAQLKNEVCDSHEERPQETAEVDIEKKE